MTSEEIEWDMVREDRNLFVKNYVDKWQLSLLYASLSDSRKTELATYRQSLLDLPQDNDTYQEAREALTTLIADKPTWMS
jgi:hypothetical protein